MKIVYRIEDAHEYLELEAEVPSALSTEALTPYQACQAVNGWLNDLWGGAHRGLPPQMIYNYVSKGYIKSIADVNGKSRIRLNDLAEWFTKYTTPKGKR